MLPSALRLLSLALVFGELCLGLAGAVGFKVLRKAVFLMESDDSEYLSWKQRFE